MTLEPSLSAELAPLTHPWSRCITVGRACELLRSDLQDHLRFLQKEFGYRHIRFHASFHDDVDVVQRLPDGRIVYRWTQLDHIYDFLVDAGYDPIVEINPMPAALASGDKTMFWYKMNITPPADFAEWERFLRAYIEHTAERYGLDRVRRWMFEVWNEPDLAGFWSGTMQQYRELYASCARVLKSFDPALRVGGPATASPAEALPFARWCREQNVPLDFLSYHSYPQNEGCQYPSAAQSPHKPGMHFPDLLHRTRLELEDAGFGHLPRIMTEWNAQSQDANWNVKWVGNTSCNQLFGASAACHLAHACDPDLDVMAWWVASDVFEEGGPQVEPHGNRFQYYGMLTVDGVPKASFHAFRFLNRMRGRRHAFALPDTTPPTRNGIVTDELASTRALFWNCVFPFDTPSDWHLDLNLPLTPALAARTEVRVTRALVREGHGSAFEAWQAMGSPPNLTRLEQEMLAARAQPEYTSDLLPVQNGRIRLSLSLKPNEIIFIEAGGDPADTPATASEDQNALDQSLMT